jgi:O-succinylbenzoic acid--CoA ligase
MDSIPCLLETQPSKALALCLGEKELTYGQLSALVSKIQDQYALDQIPKKRPVAFLATKSAETIALFFALWRERLIAVPLSPKLPEHGIAEALQATGAMLVSRGHGKKGAFIQATLAPNALSTLLFTSGTTQKPKIAAHTFSNHLESAKAANKLLEIRAGDRYLLSLPLNHVGGIAAMVRAFVAGAALVENAPTHLSLVPTQLQRLLLNKQLPKTGRVFLIGGAPLSQELLAAVLEQHLPIYQSYGMTETSSLIALQLPHTPLMQIVEGAELKIEEGEIYVRGKQLFQGYFSAQSGKTHLDLPLVDGWFATGDLGTLSPEGRLVWQGRKDRKFKSGGETIQPEELEALLLKIPGIIEAYIRPVAHEEFGLCPKALVLCNEALDLHEIERELRKQLPGYKIPKQWEKLSGPLKEGASWVNSQGQNQ